MGIQLKVAVIGGGINGLCIAWSLAALGVRVNLIEKKGLLSETSSASTKLLHGGLRYLEQGAFSLVNESLRERAWWLKNAPHVTNKVAIFLPIYVGMKRSRWKIKVGLSIYDRLAGKLGFGKHKWIDIETAKNEFPGIKEEGLIGGYQFYDGQMQDVNLGNWVADNVRVLGVDISTYTEVTKIDVDASVTLRTGDIRHYDYIINATGPWVEKLLCDSGIDSSLSLDLVRGSHIILSGSISKGLMLEHPDDHRIVFILPYKGNILVGTTEVRQSINEKIECSVQEREYLLNLYNSYFSHKKSTNDICDEFSGVRPLIRSTKDCNQISREYQIEKNGKLINVWGGKWTTSRALARNVLAAMGINHKNSCFSQA